MDNLADALKDLRAGIDDFGTVTVDAMNKHIDKLADACDRAERALDVLETIYGKKEPANAA